MFTVKFYEFAKRENSTKRPGDDTEPAATLECTALYPTGFQNPKIVVKTDKNPTFWNYAYISIFYGHRYFVDEWTLEEGFWIASLRVDCLATWRTAIGNYNGYVLRSSSEYDGTLSDTLYPVSTDPSRQVVYKTSPYTASLALGTFVIGVTGSGSAGITYYALTPSQWASFCNTMFSNPDWLGLDDSEITESLAKGLINPFQYINTCTWFPFSLPSASTVTGLTNSSTLKFGWWSFSQDCVIIQAYRHVAEHVFDLTKHPQASRGSYLNTAPYTTRNLEIFPFGRIDLDPTLLADADVCMVRVTTDLISGSAILRTFSNSSGGNLSTPINRLIAQIGVNIPVTQVTGGMLASAYANAAESMAGSFGFREVTGFLSELGSVVGGISGVTAPSSQTKGSMDGSPTFYSDVWKLSQVFYTIAEENRDHYGRPLMKNRTLKDLGGYMVVGDGDLDISATPYERAEIKRHLENGFFYE